MRRYLLVSALLCIAFLPVFGQKISRQEYIDRYKDLAVREMIATGIPASITLAQGCLESGNGNSRLAREANNHFGIKCHGWQGASVSQDDDAKGECFRKYADPEESYRDHSDFLRYRDRYAFLFELEPTDYKGWAYGLKKAGYATSPTYATDLIRVIEDNGLDRFDVLKEEESLPPTPQMAEKSIVLKRESGSAHRFASLRRTVKVTNGVAYIEASGDDTYRLIADEFNLFTSEILRYNDLRKDQPLHAGTIVYIDKKKKSSARHLDKHVVEEGETLYSLSQRYAIQLKYLYKYNNIRKGSEPEPGTIINLRDSK